MSLSYLGTEFAKSGLMNKSRIAAVAALLVQARTTIAGAASAPHVLPAMLRVVSALAVGFCLVQLAKHYTS